MTETRLGLDLGDASNAPDDTVTIKRVGNNMRLTSPAAGSIDLEDFVLPGGVHALDDHTDVDITAAATGEILRFDGADWVDVANSAMDSSDSSVLGVLRAIDAAGNVVFNEDSLDIDFRMESNGKTHAFFLQGSDGFIGINIAVPDGTLHVHTGSAGAVTANASLDDLVVENSGNAGVSVLTPNTDQGFYGFGDEDDSYIAGIDYDHGNDLFRIFANNAGRIYILPDGKVGINEIAPDATLEVGGTVHITGDTTIDGEISGDILSATFGLATVPVLNNSTESLEFAGVACSATKGYTAGGSGSIIGFVLNYDVTVHAGGGQLTAGVAVNGAVVFSKIIDSTVANAKLDGDSQARGIDTISVLDNLVLFIREDNSVAITTANLQGLIFFVNN